MNATRRNAIRLSSEGIAIAAIPQPDLQPADRIALSRSPATVSAGGVSNSRRACALEKAAVVPSSRLIAGRSTSTTGLRLALLCRTKCLNRLESADSRRRTFLLAHDPLPGDDRAVVDLAQLLQAGDAERTYEVRDIESVGAPGVRILLFRQPGSYQTLSTYKLDYHVLTAHGYITSMYRV